MIFIRKALEKITSHWVILLIEQIMIAVSLTTVILFFNILTRQQSSQTDLLVYFIANLVISLFGTWFFQTHAGIIRYTEINDITTVLKYVTFSFLAWTLVSLGFGKFLFDFQLPLFLLFAHAVFSAFLLIVFRVLIREFYFRTIKSINAHKNVIIYGAGDMGMATKRTFDLNGSSKNKIFCFIDDNSQKIGKTLSGVNVESADLMNISKLLTDHEIKEIILATNSSLSPQKKISIAEICSNHSVKLTQVPPLNQWIDGVFKLEQLKNVSIEMLLERPVIKMFNEKTAQELRDKVVLVTGAAGSIGSEICRQLTNFPIQLLVALDQSETGLFDLENEFRNSFPNTKLNVALASVRDQERINSIMQSYKPFVVFHAAAYKHVPMLELFPAEVVKTNVWGTKIVVEAASAAGAQKFVMVSTDKAVNPTNLMGASKRIAEMIVQHAGSKTNMHTITTRFGNVLGSNGSVVPTFRKQIESGGPVTVTHPDITRYFMTIPEASALVIEAGTMGSSDEIFVFDMGEPVKIIDLAHRMIRLAGYVPGEEIEIKYSGLRPGEKLYEELFSENEKLVGTHHPKIMKAMKNEFEGDFEELTGELISASSSGDNCLIQNLIKVLVPELNSTNSENELLVGTSK
jgi:FlaA1/EpsC-like NDP-sugar epimerase